MTRRTVRPCAASRRSVSNSGPTSGGARTDVGWFEARAKVSPSVRPGLVLLYHGGEPYQFKGHRSHQTVLPSPFNPIQFAGGYFHLQPFMLSGEPGHNDRGTRLEVEPVA